MKKLQDVHEAEKDEFSKQKKNLEIENEKLQHHLAKLDFNLTQVQCENKVTNG